jgi:hypothetical protein
MSPYETKIFVKQIAPIIESRLERLKELTTLNTFPDVFKTFSSKFDWERYKDKDRQDGSIAQKLDNFINTRKFSFNGLTDSVSESIVPFLYDCIKKIVGDSDRNEPLYLGMWFSDGSKRFYNLHNPDFYITFMRFLGENRFLMIDRVDETAFEFSGVDPDVMFRGFIGFEIVDRIGKDMIQNQIREEQAHKDGYRD